MEIIKRSGKAKSIGVSKFLQEHLEIILEIPPAINSIEYHPYLQRGHLIDFHRKNNIAVSACSTLTALVEGSPGPVDAIYMELAKKYAVTEGDVALRWCIDQGIVAVTTSRSLQRLKGYMENISKFKLRPAEIKQISDAGARKHYRKFLGDRFSPDDHR